MRSTALALSFVACLSPSLIAAAPFPSSNSGTAATGPGGQAEGGSVNGPANSAGGLGGLSGLGINMFSNNAGKGGVADSGDAFGGSGGTSPPSVPSLPTQNSSNKSSTKPSNKAATKPPPNQKPTSPPPAAAVAAPPNPLPAMGGTQQGAAPPSKAASSGPGGNASGGSVNGPAGLIGLFGNKAGDGGQASSGTANGSQTRRSLDHFSAQKPDLQGASQTLQGGNAAGGAVNGVEGLGLVNLFSNNAGGGGTAKSGDAKGGSGDHSTMNKSFSDETVVPKAISGAGGMAPGGSVNNPGGLVNIMSNNAGQGGQSGSGSAGSGKGTKGRH
ncbi:hypothetical protein JAAARDRAFT_189378 [Jaapia argillacea MUCL 33604]|uniref:Uncharacterized protein n=1 Tax=Jaapia argillacea MUCL 33604 TaxID=933084 RepID=A0A067QMJ3_9AGAM|nr:hypothetical protein JAAARDRAFT_189378 [Jaapia argillacea MUCL 33604]